MNEKIATAIVVVLAALLGGWYIFSATPTDAPTDNSQKTAEMIPAGDVTVTYDNNGFSPAGITVPVGTTIIFVNKSGERMWVASAKHPEHIVYDGTNLNEHCANDYSGEKPFDQCADSASYSFTFAKAGTWKYHNHANASHFGSIVVTQ